jgi:SNF family Na+-dependent transporter
LTQRRYGGKRFLVWFAIFLIVCMVVGLWMTWTIGKAMAPALKARKEERMKREAAERERIRALERGEPAGR